MSSRRNLLKIGVVSAVSFVITACTKAVSGTSESTSDAVVEDTQTQSAPEQTQSQGGEVVIAQVSALVAGAGFNFTANDGTDAILFKTKDEKVYALSRICTHEGCSVNFDLSQNKLICPCHGAEYESGEGNVLSGPTQRALKKINVKIDGDNVLEVV
ncbi:MAG: Rieske (2Fe-2S) protein [Actinobacteria bacterium]|nr:Rieske (2Fe-2S) protein [Actinomycetota bacterium]